MIYLTLFFEFFKIGLFTFGGGYAMIPLLREVCLNHNWVNEEIFYDLIGICETTPGPIAVNMATYIGSTQAGFLGSIISSIGVILPSFIIIILIASFLNRFIQNKFIKGFLLGVKPIIIGLIISSGLILTYKALNINFSPFFIDIRGIIITIILILILLIFKYLFNRKINTILFIITSAVIGIIICLIIK